MATTSLKATALLFAVEKFMACELLEAARILSNIINQLRQKADNVYNVNYSQVSVCGNYTVDGREYLFEVVIRDGKIRYYATPGDQINRTTDQIVSLDSPESIIAEALIDIGQREAGYDAIRQRMRARAHVPGASFVRSMLANPIQF